MDAFRGYLDPELPMVVYKLPRLRAGRSLDLSCLDAQFNKLMDGWFGCIM